MEEIFPDPDPYPHKYAIKVGLRIIKFSCTSYARVKYKMLEPSFSKSC